MCNQYNVKDVSKKKDETKIHIIPFFYLIGYNSFLKFYVKNHKKFFPHVKPLHRQKEILSYV